MPGCNVSAKRLGQIRGNIDALRHNWKPLLRNGKEMGCHEWQPYISNVAECSNDEFRTRPLPRSAAMDRRGEASEAG
jgi:hypothetical protein